uniref:Thymidylate kinase-like domain-containing protein n=1 Tax=Strigamia maritima TaxID=126957 RepID=T1IQH0_STRMM
MDRYAFSGVAFSAAKDGMNIKWCKQPDEGLPKPDTTIFLDLAPSSLMTERSLFGTERSKELDFNGVYHYPSLIQTPHIFPPLETSFHGSYSV